MNWKKVSIIVGCLTAIASAGWGVIEFGIGLDGRYAKASELQQVQSQLNMMQLKNLFKEALQDFYTTRSLVKKFPRDEDVKKLFEEAKRHKEEIESQIKDLKK